MRVDSAHKARGSDARPKTSSRLAVLKLGGSLAKSPELREWLAAIATEAGRIVVVPGGGPFADAVREAQPIIGFDAVAAHEMAMLAMTQFGRALQSLAPEFLLANSRSAIRRALRERRVPIWSPERMASAEGLPPTWDLTSDSLAAWLASALGADRLILVKHGRFAEGGVDLGDLVADGIVDPLLPRFVHRSRFHGSLASHTDAARLAGGLRGRPFPEILHDP